MSETGNDPFGLCVPPRVFRSQMRWVRDNCCGLTLQQLADSLESGSIPDRAVVITFDDGYRDNLTAASPILLEMGLSATFFSTSYGLDREREFWWDALARLLLDAAIVPPVLEFQCDGARQRVPTGTDRRMLLRQIHAMILPLGLRARDAMLAELTEQIGHESGPGEARAMTGTELRHLAAHHEIGAHTVHHLFLPKQSREVCSEELAGSRVQLESCLGRPVRSVAYPFGAVTTEIAALASAAGFRSGVAVGAGCVTASSDPMMLPRVEIPGAAPDITRRIDLLLRGEA